MTSKIRGKIQHYDWGERGPRAFIPRFLGIKGRKNIPYAEYWLGDHPVLPSRTWVKGRWKALPTGGRGGWPFLFKIISVARPLSLQVHPGAAEARRGYREEERKKIPLAAPNRSFRDSNAKPELLMALTPFYALLGFRSESNRKFFLRRFFMPQAEVNKLLSKWQKKLKKRRWTPKEWPFWFMKAAREFSSSGNYDRGLLAFIHLQFVHLRPGEAIFVSPGLPHTYLKGNGIEVMGNSDNVFRGGLTAKPMNIRHFIKCLDQETGVMVK